MCIRSYTDYLTNGTVVKVIFPDGREEQRFLYGNNAIPLQEYLARHQKDLNKRREVTLVEMIESSGKLGDLGEEFKESINQQAINFQTHEDARQELVDIHKSYHPHPSSEPVLENPNVAQPEKVPWWKK
jgi:hypothetical protein